MKRWLAAICAAVLFGMLWRVPAVCAAEEPEIPAAAYALMETETGTRLLESHSGDRLACTPATACLKESTSRSS